MRTPVDDTHTIHWHYDVYALPAGVPAPKQDFVPYYDAPLRQDDGSFAVDYIIGQDTMAWVTQGPIAQRQLEKLGESDKGVILYRRMLLEEMAKVEAGVEPINVFRDPGSNEIIELFQERAPGVIMKLPPNTVPLPGQWDPATGDISVAPTGKHAPVGLRARTTYQAAAAKAGVTLP
jgi:hypothetical protein